MGRRAEIGANEAPWSEAVLVCGACARRSDRKIKGELKADWKLRGGVGRLRIVEIGCLGLCPKRGIVTLAAPDLARGEVYVLGDEMPAGRVLDRIEASPARR